MLASAARALVRQMKSAVRVSVLALAALAVLEETALARSYLSCLAKKVVIVDTPKETTSSNAEENFGFWIDEPTKIVTFADGKKLNRSCSWTHLWVQIDSCGFVQSNQDATADEVSAVSLVQCIAPAVSKRPVQRRAQLGKNPAGGTGIEFLGTRLQLRACFRNLFGLGHTGRNAICSCSGEFALLALAATITRTCTISTHPQEPRTP